MSGAVVKTEHTLIVDDEPANLKLLDRILRGQGCGIDNKPMLDCFR